MRRKSRKDLQRKGERGRERERERGSWACSVPRGDTEKVEKERERERERQITGDVGSRDSMMHLTRGKRVRKRGRKVKQSRS